MRSGLITVYLMSVLSIFSVLTRMSDAATVDTCFKSGEICSQPGEVRWVDGVAIKRNCWAYTDSYVCLEPTNTKDDGCRTLVSNSESVSRTRGLCRKLKQECISSVIGKDGKSICIEERQTWVCDQQIELPINNATWLGKTESSTEAVDESACSVFAEDKQCQKQDRTCDSNNNCTQHYVCHSRFANGCTSLKEAGCTLEEPLTCNKDIDPNCKIQQAKFRCDGEIPKGTLEKGDAMIENSTTINIGSPTQNTKSCEKLVSELQENEKCELISEKCVDSEPAVRTINGRRYRAPCWGFERTFSCKKFGVFTTCDGLTRNPKCKLLHSQCVQSNQGECQRENRTYVCNGSSESLDGNIGNGELVIDSTTITDMVKVSTCGDYKNSPKCIERERRCIIPGGVRVIDGKKYEQDCWGWQIDYKCGEGETGTDVIDSCRDIESDEACHLEEDLCLGTNEAGTCTMRTKTYLCDGKTTTIKKGEVCDGLYCIGGVCESQKGSSNTDFSEGVAVMEIARQAGVYADVAQDSIFQGQKSGCTVKAAGFSCCKEGNAESGVKVGNSAFGVAITAGVNVATEAIKYAGSPYVYDILSASSTTQPLLTALYGNAGSGVYSPSFSFYGASVGMNTAGSLTLDFSPASFIAAVALELATDYFSCTQEDQIHALRRSQGLCHYCGSYCEKKGGSRCLQKKETWCCFNSRLALAIQIQGRKQLGLGWGTARSPSCRGFTRAEFDSLDFSRMDLSSIVSEIANQNEKGVHINEDAALQRARERARVIDADPTMQYIKVNTIVGKCLPGQSNGMTICIP